MSEETFNSCISISEIKNDSDEVVEYQIEMAAGNIKNIPDTDVFGIVNGNYVSMNRKAVTITERDGDQINTIKQERFCSNEDDLEYAIYTVNGG